MNKPEKEFYKLTPEILEEVLKTLPPFPYVSPNVQEEVDNEVRKQLIKGL